ncbi:RES family NAD+ phosphorylase [Coraliomargarita parva]|uniref:RES family NAD+ phosphorylase n=1 Tax=Coraliomargarita parva TaxID=3014050 RepID=UPI0022B50420|nr:RES family NAD+ phosphorylase [Coraliomargarita parva]
MPAARANHAFDGEGAQRFGGRWNSLGLPAVYLAESRALAALETLVHLNDLAQRISFVRFKVEIPEKLLASPELSQLRPFLKSASILPQTRAFGDTWLRAGAQPALRIASAIIPEEFNYLLNPLHPDFDRVRIGKAEPFAFDPRLLDDRYPK